MHGFPFHTIFRTPTPPPETSAGRVDERARAKAESAEQRVDRAMLALEAIWTLLRDRLGITDEMLARRMTELDESDGLLDGKVRRPPKPCPHCKRTIPSRFARCLYCGEPLPPAPFE